MSFLASAVAYWVGKAKDTVGTIAGHATPGWATGQLWSVSASQWEGAAWDTGGNADSHSGASQLWSATAANWHSDYNAEVTLYNNEVTLYNNEVTTANTWQTRANTAYDSGVWGSGTTWQAHANTAYDSGTWGTGNTWQTDYNNEVTLYNNEVTAYNNALSPSGVDLIHTTWSGSNPTITVDRTGYWMAFANGNSPGTQNITVSFTFNGVAGVSGAIHTNGSSQWGWSSGYDGAQLLSSGQTIVFNTGGGNNGDFWAVFVPTQAHPH